MILSDIQIRDIVLKNPNKELVKKGQEYNKLLRMFMYGENLKAFLHTIDGLESEAIRALRIKYTKSPKDLCVRALRPLDKMWSARGGSVYYNLPETNEKKARELSKDVRNGYSAKAWMENFWEPHFIDDPNGMIFFEMLPLEQAVKAKAKGKSIVYPTYKSIQCVYDYVPNGSKLEYVFFTTEKNERIAIGLKEEDIVYRLVDDSKDVYVKRESEDMVSFHAPLNNYFLEVPAILNNDMPNPQMQGNMLSVLDEVVEIINEFLLTGSIQVTHKFLHGFPRYWQYLANCNVCKGEAQKDGVDCTACKGIGKDIMQKVSDVLGLPVPTSKDDVVIAPNIGGFIEPSEIFHNMATEGMRLLEDLITYTLWGATESKPVQPGMQTNGQKTATQIVTDIKPQADRLTAISDIAEKRHKFLMDTIIRINISYSYQGSSINYGKRFMIEGPDVLWEKYQDAKLKGIAYSVLDDLLTKYYEAEYMSDPVKFHIQSKLIKVEPFVHYKISEVQTFNISDDEYKNKLYFGEWLSTLDESYLIGADAVKMKDDLTAYTLKKQLKPDPKLLKPAA